MPGIRPAIAAAVRRSLDRMGAGAVEATVEPSGRREYGDWSTPAALRAAPVLRRSPRDIAEELRRDLESFAIPFVAGWTVSGPGYVNARLDDPTWAPAVVVEALELDADVALEPPPDIAVAGGKTLVEHTAINTNKAAHIGHLRNACLGDTVARMLQRLGRTVEVDNYVDDTGVQVADVVVGLRELGIPPRADEPFDQYCSRVYVEVVRRYETDPTLVERRLRTLRLIEARDNEVAREAKVIAGRVVDAHLATMARVGIGYDLLTWESDIIELGFWRQAFGLLRDAGVIRLVEEGRNRGCWVLPAVDGGEADEDGQNGGDAVLPESATAGDEVAPDADKVLVKSDGVATYTAKDIAYQLWKLGLLGLDFHYRPWHAEVMGAPATTTANRDEGELDDAGFGAADRVITVVDARQAYLQNIVRTAVERLGHGGQAERSLHLAYEVVALTPAAARELGVEVEEGRTGGVAFSGRRGIEVRADDLLDRAIARLRPEARDDETAAALATGGVRYYLEKFGLTTIINFDFADALRVTGETGIYLQYTHARAAGILRRVEDDGGPIEVAAPLTEQERQLLGRIAGYRDALAEAAEALSPSVLCAYAFGLASDFTGFYEHTPPIVREEDTAVRRFRRALVGAAKSTLGDCLGVLGIPAPDQI